MLTFNFYTTAGCHLCENAWQVITEVHAENPQLQQFISLQQIDIATSDSLIEQYAVRIPVVRGSHEQDLAWPFDHQAYINFVNQHLEKLFLA